MKGRLALVFLALIVICVGYKPAIAADDEFHWKYVGRQAYTGTPEQAIEKLTSVIPIEVGNAFIELIKQQAKPVEGAINKGDRLVAMVFGKNELRTNVLAAWEDGVTVLKAEEWSVISGDALYTLKMPLSCKNWSVVVSAAPKKVAIKEDPKPAAAPEPVLAAAMPPAPVAPAPRRFVSGACPNGYSLIANVWSLQALPPSIRKEVEEHIAAAKNRDSQQATNRMVYETDDVSRTLGGILRKEVKVRAPVDVVIRILYRDPKTLEVVQDLGTISVVSGIGNNQFSDDPRKWIIEIIWPKDYLSPTISGNERRLWLFPKEWVNWCAMNVHGIMP